MPDASVVMAAVAMNSASASGASGGGICIRVVRGRNQPNVPQCGALHLKIVRCSESHSLGPRCSYRPHRDESMPMV
jgi:hypothetical protein